MSDLSLKARTDVALRLRETYGVEDEGSPGYRVTVGIPGGDSLVGGLPGGAITEVVGQPSSGKTTLMLSALVSVSQNDLCALVDASDALDVMSAAEAGVEFDNLLWVRCGSNLDRSLKATEMLLQSGIFALVVLDLGNLPINQTKRIESATWLRFRRSIENTDHPVLVIGQQSVERSFAGLVIEMRKDGTGFSPSHGRDNKSHPYFATLLRGLRLEAHQRRPFSLNAKADFLASTPYR